MTLQVLGACFTTAIVALALGVVLGYLLKAENIEKERQ